MFRTVVDVTDRQYSSGAHYDMAKEKAEDEGYDAVWVADEHDPGYREYGRRSLETVNVDELVVLLEGARNIVESASKLLRKYAGFECLRALGLDTDLHARTASEAGVSRRAASQINFGIAYASMGHDSTPEQQLKARAAVFGERSASAEMLRDLERLRDSGMDVKVEISETGALKLTQHHERKD